MRTRARTMPVHPAVATAAVAALTAASLAAVAAPASAATLEVTDADSWAAALETASENGTADVISILNDFSAPGSDWNYWGDEDLTIAGNGHTITWDGTDEGAALVAHIEGTLAADITVTDLTVEDFDSAGWGGIFIAAAGIITLDGVTATGTLEGPGAFLYAEGAVSILDSTFTGNHDTGESFLGEGGGGVHVTAAGEYGVSVSVVGSTFIENDSVVAGGALYVEGDASIEDSTFTDNTAQYVGGAVLAYSASIESSSFTGNSTTDTQDGEGDGGAVYIVPDSESEGGLEVVGSTFTDNTATGYGGAVYGTFLTSQTTTYEGNHADGMGGAIYAEGYSDVYNSTFSGNSSVGHGSAVYVEGYDYSWIESSTFTDNKTTAGVGTFVQERGYLDVYLSTFADNWAAGNPVHLWASGYGEGFDDDGVIFSFGSIYTGAMGSSSACAAEGFETTYNLDDDGTCTGDWSGEGDTAGDALLGELADNGGITLTREPAQDSDAIDLIPSDICLAYFDGGQGPASELAQEGPEVVVEEEIDNTLDQRGLSRLEALDYQDGGCDAGSVEVVKDITFPVETAMGDVTVTASGAWTQECVESLTIAEAGGTAPAGVAFPYGALAYCFVLPWEGGSVDITLALPTPVNQVYKTGTTWTQIPGATISEDGMTITYSVTDGGDLDEDGTTDAYIVDPAAPGVGAVFTG